MLDKEDRPFARGEKWTDEGSGGPLHRRVVVDGVLKEGSQRRRRPEGVGGRVGLGSGRYRPGWCPETSVCRPAGVAR